MQKKKRSNSKIVSKKNTTKKTAVKKPVKKAAAKTTTRKAAAKKPATKKATAKTTTKKPVTKKSTAKTAVRKTPAKKTPAIKKEPVRAGQIRTINDNVGRGHKGDILRINKKKGTADTGMLTHAPKTRGKKNIKLQQNPDPKDTRPSYVVKKKHTAKMKNVGKNHSNMKIKNSADKSVMRHLKKQK